MSDFKFIIEKAQKGDRKSFEKLYDNFSKKLFKFVYYRVKSKEDAEDLSQQIWVEIIKSLAKYKFESSFETWIFAISRNVINQYYRNIYKENSTEFEDWMMEEIKEDEILSDPTLEKKLREFLKTIKPTYAKILELRFFKGYKIKEISEELNITISNAKVSQMRAIKSLKEKIGNISNLRRTK